MTTKSLKDNVVPANWRELFKEGTLNVFANEPTLQHTAALGPDWKEPPYTTASEGATELHDDQ